MKKLITTLVRRFGIALAAVALLPTVASAATATFTVDSLEAEPYDYALKVTHDIITLNVIVQYETTDWPGVVIDENTIDEDNFKLRFLLSNGESRYADFLGVLDNEDGTYLISFQYEVTEDDYSIGVFSYNGSMFYGNLTQIKNQDGKSLATLINRVRPVDIATPFESQPDNASLRINPDNATRFTVNFLDEYGEKVSNTAVWNLTEGQTMVPYLVNIGSTPAPDAPVDVYINWGVENVFCEGSVTTQQMTQATQVFYIERILDDGAVPPETAAHDYTITAVTDGRPDATFRARVSNEKPVIDRFYASTPWGTNTVLAVGETISATVQISDASYGQLDEPVAVEWKFGAQTPTNVVTEWKGSYWESTAYGSITRTGLTSISVTFFDKDRGSVSTNDVLYAEQGPLLMATVADAPQAGLSNLGVGTIKILESGSGTIVWDPILGNYLSGTLAILDAICGTDANGYDSFWYKWFCGEDKGKDIADTTRGLLDGANPIEHLASVNLLADTSAGLQDRAPKDRAVRYYFSREFYRPDDFGDIDGDGLGDAWEIANLNATARNFTDPVTDEAVVASESGTPVYGDDGALLYDFSGTGNMDGDGLPACGYVNHELVVTDNDATALLPAGTYNVEVFQYPLAAATIRDYGYLPIGGNRMTDDLGNEKELFMANPYVSDTAKGQIANIFVNFANELEFRGVGRFIDYDDGVETISFRPYGDGDEPRTSPVSPDSDFDGRDDGWEYYFWATAFYNVNPDQWRAFNGAAPVNNTFQGTGDLIERDTILNNFNPMAGGGEIPDTDNDGLTDLEEYALGTNPIHWDTDGDGLPDGFEVDFGLLDENSAAILFPPANNPPAVGDIVLNPLVGDDAGKYNGDGDFFATDGTLVHKDVYLNYDFDPRTGWCNPQIHTVTYAGNTFQGVPYVNTAAYTARDEFDYGAYLVQAGLLGAVSPDPNADNYWGKVCTDPRTPDSDNDGMPDGWEAYVYFLDPRNGNDAGDLNDADGLSNLEEFLCTMAADVYPYIAADENLMNTINGWDNKPWPTNPNPSIGVGYTDGTDTDYDQFNDDAERGPNCNPTCVDTDHDWLPDLWECHYGTEPLVPDPFMDYDGDGLQNWQEYLTGAVWSWQYDKWYDRFRGTTGPGFHEVDMMNFFFSPDEGAENFGRLPLHWDNALSPLSRVSTPHTYQAGLPLVPYFYFQSAESRAGVFDSKLYDATVNVNQGYDNHGNLRAEYMGNVMYATTDPWEADSDHDGMDDFYEAYHGLNPLYGGSMLVPYRDLVGKIDPLTMSPYPSSPWDLTVYPWLSGDPAGDPDKDGLANFEEAANFYAEGGAHHTDPSPLWLTDVSYDRSFTSLYYTPGRLANYWYFAFENNGPIPEAAFSFEMNEGYDTDNDNVPDRSELSTDELRAYADPLDADTPRRRKAMYFNGVDAACRTHGAHPANDPSDLQTFTVEAWIRPANPAAGHIQTLVERSAFVPQDTAQGDTVAKRLNFRLSITETGALRGEFHNYQGAHVTAETTAANAGLRAGSWNHVALTYDGTPASPGFLTVYVNGISRAASPSALKAFNGIVEGRTSEYYTNISTNQSEVTGEFENTTYGAPVVLGASDARPDNTVNGHFDYVLNAYPNSEPVLSDFFEGWMDEVRIWDGAVSPEALRARMYERFDLDDVAAYQTSTDKNSNETVGLRYHYTFDNLPDLEPAPDRASDAVLSHSDIEALPFGFAQAFTAPHDGSYPGVPWWHSSKVRSSFYDTRHIPWIENTVAHLPGASVADSPRILSTTSSLYDDGSTVAGWYETVYTPEFEPRSRTVNAYHGVEQVAARLPYTTDPYGVVYDTVRYVENFAWSVGSAGTQVATVTDNGDGTSTTNTATVGASETIVVYEYDNIPEDVGLQDSDYPQGEAWFSDLLPLGGAVADIDIDLWDGLGVGYELVTVDSDGDGIPDYWESLYGLDPYDASDAWDDTDSDGLDNLAEYLAGTDPLAEDSDGDGYTDYLGRDSAHTLTYGELYDDKDGLPSWWEHKYGLNPRADDASADADGDGWSNKAEYLAGTDPTIPTNYPEPPVDATIYYDGAQTAGTLYLYAYSTDNMTGNPDAVYSQDISSAGDVTVTDEYLCTIEEGRTEYAGKLAYANLAGVDMNNADFTVTAYHALTRTVTTLSFAPGTSERQEVTSVYCTGCGKLYVWGQDEDLLILADGSAKCPHGHWSMDTPMLFRRGYELVLRNVAGEFNGEPLVLGTFFVDSTTGEWQLRFSGDFSDYAGLAITATYTGNVRQPFPFNFRKKFANGSATNPGHLREGTNRFFAFLDLDGDALFDEGEPAGMALYQPFQVGVGAVQLEIPLTDYLFGFPRFAWTEVATGEAKQYTVTVNDLDTGLQLFEYPLDSTRTFFMEQDLLAQGGVIVGQGDWCRTSWSVRESVGTVGYGDEVPTTLKGPEIASGTNFWDVALTERKAVAVQYPAEGAVVSDVSLPVRWTMDYRTEGARITITPVNESGAATGGPVIDKFCFLPRRVGSLTGDYYYTIEPQKLLGDNRFAELPDGIYSLTVTEFIRNPGVTRKSATVKKFYVDHSGWLSTNASANGLGSISGSLSYYGKIPYTAANDVASATYDGLTASVTVPLPTKPTPGTLSVAVVSGSTTNFVASDVGGKVGYSTQPLNSSYGSMIGESSYVTYGDAPSVTLSLETAPSAGSKLVVWYKRYVWPIRIQAFATDLPNGASFSQAPAYQTTVYNKGAYSLDGLPAGTYYVRAFIDMDKDSQLDEWESVGYVLKNVTKTVAMGNFRAIDVPAGANDADILIQDRDTDTDLLPDAWEFYKFGAITNYGGYTYSKPGVYLWQEYADGELDSDPLVEDTDGDGLPDAVEHYLGTSNEDGDSDGDGVGDLEEFLAGSNPADKDDTLRFASPAPTFLEDGTPALELETPELLCGLYLYYEVYAKDSLAQEDWTYVGRSATKGVEKTPERTFEPRGTVLVPDPYGGEAAFYTVKACFESDTLLLGE